MEKYPNFIAAPKKETSWSPFSYLSGCARCLRCIAQ